MNLDHHIMQNINTEIVFIIFISSPLDTWLRMKFFTHGALNRNEFLCLLTTGQQEALIFADLSIVGHAALKWIMTWFEIIYNGDGNV